MSSVGSRWAIHVWELDCPPAKGTPTVLVLAPGERSAVNFPVIKAGTENKDCSLV